MAQSAERSGTDRRTPLTRQRVVDAAAVVADAGGLEAVSMRNVGRELGVEAMSLYHHVRNKEDLLDALADWIFSQINLPALGDPWRAAMESRAASARDAVRAHPWGLGLIDSRRSPGPAMLRHHDTVLGCLLRNGFPLALGSHAFSAIDSYVYGFVLTELSLPFAPGSEEDFAVGLAVDGSAYPHLAELVEGLVRGGRYAFADEFGYGLALILDGLEARLRAARNAGPTGEVES